MKILKIFFVLFIVNIAFSQNITKLLPDNNEIKGWVKSGNSRIFEGERLYEYIDGAAETYHNYGFRQVITQDYKNGNNQIVVDIYEMKDVKNTFGIYSIERDPNTILLILVIKDILKELRYTSGKVIITLKLCLTQSLS